MKISIAIPCYEMKGLGVECLEFSFQKIKEQTFTDFEVVISDSSNDNRIELLCKKWEKEFNLKYIKSPECAGNPALNSTKAMKNCNGEWIKFLCLDDFFLNKDSLLKTVNALDNSHNWLASAYIHTYDRVNFERYHLPQMNPNIFVVNTIGSPSCATFKNVMDFDENLFYCYDCDFYWRFFQKYGEPKILSEATIGTLLGKHSLTSELATQEFIGKENNYILKKYGFIK
jgi:glycosyltransferase involved in cell wall biosynthesis